SPDGTRKFFRAFSESEVHADPKVVLAHGNCLNSRISEVIGSPRGRRSSASKRPRCRERRMFGKISTFRQDFRGGLHHDGSGYGRRHGGQLRFSSERQCSPARLRGRGGAAVRTSFCRAVHVSHRRAAGARGGTSGTYAEWPPSP